MEQMTVMMSMAEYERLKLIEENQEKILVVHMYDFITNFGNTSGQERISYNTKDEFLQKTLTEREKYVERVVTEKDEHIRRLKDDLTKMQSYKLDPPTLQDSSGITGRVSFAERLRFLFIGRRK